MTLLRALWLDAVVGWQSGSAAIHRAKYHLAAAKAERAEAAWYALNPHPFNPPTLDRSQLDARVAQAKRNLASIRRQSPVATESDRP